jgi:hypothetical protein
MTATLTFHVPPDAGPEGVNAIFNALSVTGDGALSATVLREQVAGMLGKQPRGEALALGRDLDLVAQTTAVVRLTPRGKAVVSAAEPNDLVHGFSYFAWSEEVPERLSRMWTYRMVVDLLWEAAPTVIDPTLKKRLVEELFARAEPAFASTGAFDPGRTSLGPKSIEGVQRWLEQLTPAVVRDRRIGRRQRCPPLLMVLALGATARNAGAEVGTDFRLGPGERDTLCRACFLDPVALDTMLEWTVQTQPHRVRWGTTNARYGRQLVMVDLGPLL